MRILAKSETRVESSGANGAAWLGMVAQSDRTIQKRTGLNFGQAISLPDIAVSRPAQESKTYRD